MPTLSRLVYKPPKSYNEITTKQNKFMEVIIMSNILSLLKNDFEILESKTITIDENKNTLQIYFPKNKVTITFNRSPEVSSDGVLHLAKDTSIEYTIHNYNQFFKHTFINIAQFSNRNLYFSFDIEEDLEKNIIFMKTYLAKKIN